jgi:hypothetical protein
MESKKMLDNRGLPSVGEQGQIAIRSQIHKAAHPYDQQRTISKSRKIGWISKPRSGNGRALQRGFYRGLREFWMACCSSSSAGIFERAKKMSGHDSEER